jgi:hypothetical protein
MTDGVRITTVVTDTVGDGAVTGRPAPGVKVAFATLLMIVPAGVADQAGEEVTMRTRKRMNNEESERKGTAAPRGRTPAALPLTAAAGRLVVRYVRMRSLMDLRFIPPPRHGAEGHAS